MTENGGANSKWCRFLSFKKKEVISEGDKVDEIVIPTPKTLRRI